MRHTGLNSTPPPLDNANWIWIRGRKRPDCYAVFRREFSVSRLSRDATLRISADSDFVAWVNGVEVARGQFSDFAESRTYGMFSVGEALRRGINVLAVEVFHRGADFSDHQAGTAGLIAELRAGGMTVRTDSNWRGMAHPAFRSGHAERVTQQFGFTFSYDARREADWKSAGFHTAGWLPVVVRQRGGRGGIWKELDPRPLPALVVGDLQPVRAVSQGSFVRLGNPGGVADAMAESALLAESPAVVFDLKNDASAVYQGPPRNPAGCFGSEGELVLRPPQPETQGRFLVLDLGEETVGLLEFEIEATAGTVLEIAHGEHLDDGRVRAKIDGRNFADRYICRDGRQRFQMPYRRLGARFLEVHASKFARLAIHDFSLRTVGYPTPKKSRFEIPDSTGRRIHGIAVRTLELCRHEHYEDCPWREQSLYAYDGRLQALYGYHAFGDYRFPEVSFALLARSLDANGFLALTAPGLAEITIPIFSFAWIAAVAEHWRYGGDPTLFRQHEAVVSRILEKAFALRDPATGLYRTPDGKEFWHFYEWTEGLCGSLGNDPLPPGEFHAGYNLHLLEAGDAMAWMLARSGRTDEADRLQRRLNALRRAIHSAFWDRGLGYYRSVLAAGGERRGDHELIQALALSQRVVPRSCWKSVAGAMTLRGLAPCTLSASFYLVRGFLDASPASRDWLWNRLFSQWERMVLQGATAMWETAAGADDFDYAGSLCHGWSALPVFYNHAAILGIEPIEPGFARFRIRIHPSHQSQAEGTVPTPHGDISIRWEKCPRGLMVEASGPACCVPELRSFPEAPVESASYNGTQMGQARG